MARARMDQHQSSQLTTQHCCWTRAKSFSRWAEHFNALLNKQSVVSEEALQDTPQLHTLAQLDFPPNCAEVTKAIKQQSSGKTAGPDGIPPEVYKCGGASHGVSTDQTVPSLLDEGRCPTRTKRRVYHTPVQAQREQITV